MKTRRLAFCSMVCTLSLLSMLLTAIFPMADYVLPALSGILLCAIVIDYGFRPAILGYLVVSVLSVLLVANKFSVLVFAVFLGFYPLLKGKIEGLRNRKLEWAVKFGCFNGLLLIALLVMWWWMSEIYASWLLFGLVANVTFVVYDMAISQSIRFYLQKIRPKFHR